MTQYIEDDVEYYYDSHPTEEDLMGETSAHADLIHYLMEVLKWLFVGQTCAIYENLNHYQAPDQFEYPLAPDIALFKGIAPIKPLRSWRVGKTGPAPHVVFEIASEETWKSDLEAKPAKYARMGVQEYFAYDPNEPPLRPSRPRRLFGWKLDAASRTMKALPLGPGGSLWSPRLESWLVSDGANLRLYDNLGQMRLTKAEAETQRAEMEAERAEMEAQRAEMEARKAQKLAEKLRLLGIDPDEI